MGQDMGKDELRDLKKGSSQENSQRIWLLKRFLHWIAKGADKSYKGIFCPT